jgi:hypothetical protein
VRSGNTPTEGEYKEHVKKGLAFVFDRIEKADADSLSVTDVRNTQLQSKIGPYVDTFLANLVMAELKGKAGDQEKRLGPCLDKTLRKITKNQQGNGQFAGNGGWAPILSQALANKGLSQARAKGAAVSDEVLSRAAEQSRVAVAATGTSSEGTSTGGRSADGARVDKAISGGGFGGGGVGAPAFARPADAGVPLYSLAQGAGNSQDILNSFNGDAGKAQMILADAKSTVMAKGLAKQQLARVSKLSGENAAAQKALRGQIQNASFVAGFGSNGGEEFLSFLNISEALLIGGGPDWEKWDKKMTDGLVRAQDQDGSWSGQHCITGKTFCTAAALLVLTADRTQFPAAAIEQAKKDVAKAAEKDSGTKGEKKK